MKFRLGFLAYLQPENRSKSCLLFLLKIWLKICLLFSRRWFYSCFELRVRRRSVFLHLNDRRILIGDRRHVVLFVGQVLVLVSIELSPLLFMNDFSVRLAHEWLHNNPWLGILALPRSPRSILLVISCHYIDGASVWVVKLT